MSETENSTTQHFVWDLHWRLPLVLQDGKLQFIYGPNGMPLEQIASDGTVLWFHQDQQGSTRGLSRKHGIFAVKYNYDPYGGLVGPLDPVTPLMFAGQYTDAQSGLQYLRARYYDPVTGQFLTRDPLASATLHPYLYSHGDPVNRVDPSGMNDDDWLENINRDRASSPPATAPRCRACSQLTQYSSCSPFSSFSPSARIWTYQYQYS